VKPASHLPALSSVEDAALVSKAEALAARMLEEAEAAKSKGERKREGRVARLLDDNAGRAWVLALTDEVLRIREPERAARQLRELIEWLGSPEFLGPVDRLLLRVGAGMAARQPRLVMPLVAARVRAELAPFVISAAPRPLGRYIARRKQQGVRVNINPLGEAVLGNEEAERRLGAVIDLLHRPDVDYVSVKISSVCAQIVPAAFNAEVDRIAVQLRRLYNAASAYRPAKFVNLDMEEYRDLHLTVAAFRRVLDEPAYAGLDAGIVLQAYLPDSAAVLADLVAWARRRHATGAGRVKVRIVKGANLAMEQVTAELAGWPQPPYDTKAAVDANYKRMLDIALDPANQAALRIGVATHNLFEAAWAITLADARGLRDMVELEMLEGMAPSLAAAVKRAAGGMLVYAPVAPPGDDEASIAYLVRRFDENTGPENFLRNQFSLRPGGSAWVAEQTRFETAVSDRHQPSVATRMIQDRRVDAGGDGSGSARPFANEPDTDFSLAANRAWIAPYLSPPSDGDFPLIPAVVAARTIADTGRPPATGSDPARPGAATYHWVQLQPAHVDEAVAAAVGAGQQWRASGPSNRQRLLLAAADELSRRRGPLVGTMARDGGKTLAEADPEVSEAIDFCRYYAGCIDGLTRPGARFEPYPTVAVVPPWNFPLAIPAGGVAAALAAGSCVLLKPAPETVATAAMLAEAFWSAGVPRDVLQLVPCADDEAGRRLVTHPDVDAVILTGSWETARMFLGWRPDLRLRAETSGKNAIVVTAAADLDAAVADLVLSAFGHAGQKCSAASLAVVEASVYDDPRFLRQLADAVRTLRPGPGWDPTTTIGPLVRPPEGPLVRALTRLDPGESWLVQPAAVDGHPQLYTPGVRLGVQPGSWFHLTECFGPVLGVMRAADLDEAIRWQNMPTFGLTAGIQSLDPAEIARWRDRIEAGNLYVNRVITGAVVRRQPFGGWKRSVVGPGAKAGGPNYVRSLGAWTSDRPDMAPADLEAGVKAALGADLAPTDPSGLAAEANVLRYQPISDVLLRLSAVAPLDLDLALAAARAVGTAVTVSIDPADAQELDGVAGDKGARPVVETETELAARLRPGLTTKLRLLGVPSAELRLAAHDAGLWVDDSPVVADAGLEALRWVREQAISETLHRHGNLTGRYRSPLDA
jgi:RHH-type transcriptional regulator, proline utilization regulon repressor / proline dehydrogenase / delta 1-pyrroline-5-carboxylate dehydrogenase